MGMMQTMTQMTKQPRVAECQLACVRAAWSVRLKNMTAETAQAAAACMLLQPQQP
jgi:hypothetical protein